MIDDANLPAPDPRALVEELRQLLGLRSRQSLRDRTFPELLVDGLEPWKVQQLWLGFAAQPNICVDISDSIEAKRAALAAHPSQFGDDIHEFVIGMARNDAREHEFEFGESFHRITLDAPVHETEPPPVS